MNEFFEILDFAIERERSAIEFYQEMQKIAKFKPQIEVLKEFEMMEHGHVTLLENVKKNNAFKTEKSLSIDLAYSDYLIQHTPAADMTFQDIVTTAIKKEEHSMALYKRLASEASLSAVRDVFERLMAEEAAHKHHFEVMYESEISPDN